MCGLAVGVLHLLAVAVIGGDQERAARGAHGRGDGADAGVHRLDGVDGRVELAGVADHVGVGEVDEDEVVLAALDGRHHLVRDAQRAHLGLEIVGGDVARGGDELAVLALEGLLPPAAEEVGHVRVLLGLGAAELAEPRAREELAEGVRDHLLGEGDGEPEGGVVVGHGGVRALVEGAEVVAPLSQQRGDLGRQVAPGEHGGELAHAVGPEVEGEARLPADPLRAARAALEALVRADAGGLDELVVGARGVGLGERLARRRRPRRVAADDGLEGFVDAVPALVAVHRPVAAGDGADDALLATFEVRLELGQEAARAPRRGVAAVEEGVDDHRHLPGVGGVDEREEVAQRRVHAAVRDEAEEVEAAAALRGELEGAGDDRVVAQRVVGHGDVDARDVHHRDAARAEVEVPDLAVAHLPDGQADVGPAGPDERVRPGGQRGEVRRGGEPDRVGVALRAFSIAVEDAEDERAGAGGGGHARNLQRTARRGRAFSPAPLLGERSQ